MYYSVTIATPPVAVNTTWTSVSFAVSPSSLLLCCAVGCHGASVAGVIIVCAMCLLSQSDLCVCVCVCCLALQSRKSFRLKLLFFFHIC